MTVSERKVADTVEMQGAQPAGLPFSVGDRFPDITLPTVSGEGALSAGSFRGQHLLFHFFASW